MNLKSAKVYNDGSHYVAIPKGAFPNGKGCKRRVVKPTEQQPQTTESPPETTKDRFETAYMRFNYKQMSMIDLLCNPPQAA